MPEENSDLRLLLPPLPRVAAGWVGSPVLPVFLQNFPRRLPHQPSPVSTAGKFCRCCCGLELWGQVSGFMRVR
ncbi:hypothetical protein SLA2020_148640 [Shorea laevis]